MKKEQHETNLKKMDVVSRRRFLRNVGFFLGAFSVSTLVRLETMEKMSRKILGSSTAFAQGTSDENVLNFFIYQEGGYPIYDLLPLATDHLPNQHERRNIGQVPAQIIQYNDTGGNPLNLSVASQALEPYRFGIQMCPLFKNTGHRPALASAALNAGGQGNLAIWAAQKFQSPALSNSIVYTLNGREAAPLEKEKESLPDSLSDFHPEYHRNITSLLNKYSKLTPQTQMGQTLSDSQRNVLFTQVNSQFTTDIEKAIATSKSATMKNDFNNALEAMKLDLSDQLNPDMDDSGIIDSLRAGASSTAPKVGGTLIADGFYTYARAYERQLTNNFCLINAYSGDWHDIVGYAGTNPNALSIQGATYLAQSIRNIFDTVGQFTNPNSGDPLRARVIIASEFQRTALIRDTSAGLDNGDGGLNSSIILVSDPADLNGLNPGTFGGVDENGTMMTVDTDGNLQPGGSKWSHQSLRIHLAKALNLKDQAQLSEDDDYENVSATLG